MPNLKCRCNSLFILIILSICILNSINILCEFLEVDNITYGRIELVNSLEGQIDKMLIKVKAS